MNTDTGEIAPLTEIQKRIASGETDRRKWRPLTPEEYEHLRTLTPAERIAWNVRRKMAINRQS